MTNNRPDSCILTVGGAGDAAVGVHGVVAAVRGRRALQRVVVAVPQAVAGGRGRPRPAQRGRQLLQVIGGLQARDDPPVVALECAQLVWKQRSSVRVSRGVGPDGGQGGQRQPCALP